MLASLGVTVNVAGLNIPKSLKDTGLVRTLLSKKAAFSMSVMLSGKVTLAMNSERKALFLMIVMNSGKVSLVRPLARKA